MKRSNYSVENNASQKRQKTQVPGMNDAYPGQNFQNLSEMQGYHSQFQGLQQYAGQPPQYVSQGSRTQLTQRNEHGAVVQASPVTTTRGRRSSMSNGTSAQKGSEKKDGGDNNRKSSGNNVEESDGQDSGVGGVQGRASLMAARGKPKSQGTGQAISQTQEEKKLLDQGIEQRGDSVQEETKSRLNSRSRSQQSSHGRKISRSRRQQSQRQSSGQTQQQKHGTMQTKQRQQRNATQQTQTQHPTMPQQPQPQTHMYYPASMGVPQHPIGHQSPSPVYDMLPPNFTTILERDPDRQKRATVKQTTVGSKPVYLDVWVDALSQQMQNEAVSHLPQDPSGDKEEGNDSNSEEGVSTGRQGRSQVQSQSQLPASHNSHLSPHIDPATYWRNWMNEHFSPAALLGFSPGPYAQFGQQQHLGQTMPQEGAIPHYQMDDIPSVDYYPYFTPPVDRGANSSNTIGIQSVRPKFSTSSASLKNPEGKKGNSENGVDVVDIRPNEDAEIAQEEGTKKISGGVGAQMGFLVEGKAYGNGQNDRGDIEEE